MHRNDERTFAIRADADSAAAVMAVGDLARSAGFAPADRTRLMTAVAELAGNILKYAVRGQVRVARVSGPDGEGLEVVAADQGPGIADVARALTDRFSTGGTLGLGLPGVRRMMDEFEIDSAPGRGTRVVIRKWKR